MEAVPKQLPRVDRIPTSGPSRQTGWIMLLAMSAFLIEGYGFHFYWLSDTFMEMKGNASKLVTGVLLPFVGVATVFFPLPRWLRKKAQRRALLSADEARLTDPRRPILVLRSFRDDQVSLTRAKIPWFMRFFDPGTVAGTLEELIVRDLAYLGPVVAIGNPSDQLPALGAARKYCQGDEWHEVVQSLMDEAIMIVVGADLSEGLTWEIATIRRKGLLGKTTFILPPGGIADKGVLLSLLRLLGGGREMPVLPSHCVPLCLVFPVPDWGVLLVATRVTELEYELALLVGIHGNAAGLC